MPTIKLLRIVTAAALFAAVSAFGQYEQATVGTYGGTNPIEKSATPAPNDLESFITAVGMAFDGDQGGVFHFPTSAGLGTTIFRGTFGVNQSKRVQFTTSRTMQSVGTGGTFTPTSGGVATTSNSDVPDNLLTFGPIIDVATEQEIPGEIVAQVGVAILSRTHATYPLDIRLTANFTDGTSESVTANVGNPRPTDDTFYGFTAPEGSGIASLLLESFATGTENPVNTRICIDDLGFILGGFSPPPVFRNVIPANFAIHKAEDGIHFEVVADEPIETITATLNGADITGDLVVTGELTERSVSYSGLQADQEYVLEVTASNAPGISSLTRTFYTATSAFALYDSEGFTSDELYPAGFLQPVTHGSATWAPHATEPAEIVNVGEPQGKVLEKLNMGASRADFLHFQPVSSGTLTIEFDVFVSTTEGRTIDMTIQPPDSGAMTGFLSWGGVTGKLSYFDNVEWLPLADLESGWHTCKIINYLSGPARGRFDVLINDVPVGEKILWRNAIAAGTPFTRLRFHSQDVGPIFEYGRIDNLVLMAAPEDPNAFPPPSIVNISPASGAIVPPGEVFSFEVTSLLPISASDITMLVNDAPVTPTITGSANHFTASFDELGLGGHTIEIQAANGAGTTTATSVVNVTDEPWLLHPSEGWINPWEYTSGGPLLRSDPPLDGTAPYLQLDIGGAWRNLMRQYESTATMDIDRPHFIRWKFRLLEEDFDANFTVFEDRIHFFARNAPRLGGGTDASMSWAIYAHGGAHSSGAVATQTFWIYDNIDGTRAFNSVNEVNSGIQVRPDHVYSFEVLVFPADQTYSVVIVDETADLTFTSSAPHRFRAANVTGTSHTMIHFGLRANPTSDPRAFDFGPISIVPETPLLILLDPVIADGAFSFSFHSQPDSNHTVEFTSALGAAWNTLETIVGDGSIKTVTDPNPSGAMRFYRVTTSSP